MWALAIIALLRGSFRRRVLGMLRVSVYLGVLAATLTVLTVRRVKAQVDEHSFRFAKDLLPIADLLEGATGLRLNGQTINLSVTVLPDADVTTVLDRMERSCRDNPGPFARRLNTMAEQLPSNVPGREQLQRVFQQAALSREESEGQGAVLCFTRDKFEKAIRVGAETEELGELNDLSELGNLRYLVAAPGSEKLGEERMVRVISVWTQGSFRLDALAPPPFGDAVGSDSVLFPRPPHSVRLFSAEAVGAPYAVRLYESDAPPAEVLAFYDKELAAWSPFSLRGYEEKGRAFVRNGIPLLLTVARDEQKTLVTLTELGGAAYDVKTGLPR